jgi:hypothetical protein
MLAVEAECVDFEAGLEVGREDDALAEDDFAEFLEVRFFVL